MTYARCSAHAQVIEISMSNRCMSKEVYSYVGGAGAVGRGPRRAWAPGKIEEQFPFNLQLSTGRQGVYPVHMLNTDLNHCQYAR